jgi:ABC-type phosphate/phosphonate transport system substrate-binding protein
MKTQHLLTILIVLIFALGGIQPSPVQAKQTVKFGFLAKRGKAKTIEQWSMMLDALQASTGLDFEIVPLAFTEIEPAIKSGRIDFLSTNPLIFVDQEQKYGVTPLVTKINIRMGKALSRFGGVIFVKADSPIRTIGDIRGKTFMCVKKSSFGGGQMAFRHLIENGLNPFTETSLVEGRTHDNVVLAVQTGMVDVGTVRSDTLERMAEEGKIRLGDFRLIDRAEDDFPFMHTTRLYPEWVVLTLPHVSQQLQAKVKAALLALDKDNPALKKAKIAGWTEPLDYRPVAKTLIINLLNGLQQ